MGFRDDSDFETKRRAFYYVHVIEIPTSCQRVFLQPNKIKPIPRL